VKGLAASKLHEVATVLYILRKHKPEAAERINILLDEVIHPAIHEITRIEEGTCPTSRMIEEQKSTLTLVK